MVQEMASPEVNTTDRDNIEKMLGPFANIKNEELRRVSDVAHRLNMTQKSCFLGSGLCRVCPIACCCRELQNEVQINAEFIQLVVSI